jgi:hemoglobin/transferrin/lactoferrin receptor protein
MHQKCFLVVLAILVWLCSTTQVLYAQSLTIQSDDKNTPINDVTVTNLNQDQQQVTNNRGRAELAGFDAKDTLRIQHPRYRDITASIPELKRQGYTITMTEEVMPLDEVVVSATRWRQQRAEVPNKVKVLPEDDISFSNPQTSADLLDASNEVFVQKSQLGGGSPMIRGFATKSVLLSVDGVRMNNAIFRGGNLQNVINLDPYAIERTEVIFGPGSVIHGSDALGGVMSFRTKTPNLAPGDSFQVSGQVNTRLTSANQERTAHLELNLGTEEWGFLSSFTTSRFGDQEMGSKGNPGYRRDSFVRRINGTDRVRANPDPDKQVPSGFDEWFAMQKIRFDPKASPWQFDYGFHFSRTSDIPRYDRLTLQDTTGRLTNATWYYGPQIWMMNNLKVRYQDKTALFDQAKLTVAQQFYEESRHDRGFQETALRHREEQVDIYTANWDFNKQFAEDVKLFYGFQGVFNKVNSEARTEDVATGAERPAATRYPDGSDYQTYAAYANLEHGVGEDWTFNLGARYTQVLLNADLADNQDFYPLPFTQIDLNTGALNGNAGAVYHPGNGWRFRLNASSGFRAPNIDDVGKVFDSEPGAVVVPNKNLSPEYAYNGEVGLTKRWEDQARLSLTGYVTRVSNSMVRRPLSFNGRDSIVYDGEKSETLGIQNASSSLIYGGSINGRVFLTPDLRFRGKYTYTEGETEAGAAVRHVAPPFGAAHLIYEPGKLKVDGYVKFNQQIPYADLAPSERGKPNLYAADQQGRPYSPEWYTLNVRGSYTVSSQLTIQAGLTNILDKRYRPYSSGIAAPGRNLYLSLEGRF